MTSSTTRGRQSDDSRVSSAHARLNTGGPRRGPLFFEGPLLSGFIRKEKSSRYFRRAVIFGGTVTFEILPYFICKGLHQKSRYIRQSLAQTAQTVGFWFHNQGCSQHESHRRRYLPQSFCCKFLLLLLLLLLLFLFEGGCKTLFINTYM